MNTRRNPQGLLGQMMLQSTIKIKITAVLVSTALALTVLWPVQTAALTIKEEKELSKEFLKVIASRYQLITDPCIVDYVNRIGHKILAHMPPQPFTYQFYVIDDNVYNAFASPAGHIFVNRGLLAALDNESELAGILAHEIAHVVCRHLSQRIERSKKINLATLAGMVAGVFIGMGGAAAAGNAVAMGSVAAGQSLTLAYSRDNEIQADQLGLNYLKNAGYSAKGLLTSLQKIRSQQWFGSDQVPTYLMTHPAAEDRLAYIGSWIEQHEKATDKPDVDDRFLRIHTRIMALFGEPDLALQQYSTLVKEHPKDVYARYGYALVLSRVNLHQQSIEQMKKVLELRALDPFFHQEMGSIYFLAGRYEEALSVLDKAISNSQDDVMGRYYLGRTHLSLNQLEAAAADLQGVIESAPEYDQAYYFLGETFGRMNRMGDAHYYLGIYYERKHNLKNALFHLNQALRSTHDPQRHEEIKRRLAGLGKEERDVQKQNP